MPGMQNPHCAPPLSRNASANARWSNSVSPSVVVTAAPSTSPIGVTQESRARPFTSTVQQPQAACGEQPSLAETTCASPRSQSRSESRGSPSKSSGAPLSSNLISGRV